MQYHCFVMPLAAERQMLLCYDKNRTGCLATGIDASTH